MTAPSQTSASAPANFRDLGGIPTAGGAVRSGSLFRSDDLATVTAESARELLDRHGIRHVLDLRSAGEVELTGRGPLGRLPVSYHHIPFTESLMPGGPLPGTAEELGAWYADMVERIPERVVLALELIAAAPGPVVFHCMAGKDRTGVLAAVVLIALGAEPPAIVADYVDTDANLPRINDRIRAAMASLVDHAPPRLPARDSPLMRAVAPTMESFLAELDSRHDHPLEPLRAAGLSPGTEARLRARLVTGA